ncbi:uncharacterized protein LOC112564259 isoform X2 [Pomacea canaliculata]|uniref:uncharacterized protein LOC112564259 isoform X2 n=1 Tax=Pomacea canaliculata TaxID=400727 RepID=UPI000D73C6D3|nr:uncharacterized protein LOC112564259 isoform X2 [Pomacea canaliculata]XP_025094743.1 uncharacterized protein LOC112564259 isoform X2 [Pomacea canaliculata]XP_025094744.1 uncharacterized protein LOC112564259 isoform X2 [Pomacea canaliculata]
MELCFAVTLWHNSTRLHDSKESCVHISALNVTPVYRADPSMVFYAKSGCQKLCITRTACSQLNGDNEEDGHSKITTATPTRCN